MLLLVIDGYSIICRAYYGGKPFKNSKGITTNAINGFFLKLLKLCNDFNPDRIAVAFDLGKETFRREMYSDYKATRQPMPDELREQVPCIKDILAALGIPTVSYPGYEADDMLGILSRIYEEKGWNVLLCTGDRDSFQLVTDKTKIVYTKTGEDIIVDEKYIMEKYGVEVSSMTSIKALMGDASDNIPGVKGVGEKTALSLVQEYKTVDNIYENLDKIKPAIRKKLEEDKDNCYLSLKPGIIKTSAGIPLTFESAEMGEYDKEKLKVLLDVLELWNLKQRL